MEANILSKGGIVDVKLQNVYKQSFLNRAKKDFKRNKYVYFMAIPVLLFFLVFCYLPMYGALIAFQDYNIVDGFFGSEWVGLHWFKKFFTDYTFIRILKNTLILSFTNILWGFPAPIILALLLNEVKSQKYKRCVQTVVYIPHFISVVVICGLIKDFLGRDGIITMLLTNFGLENTNLLSIPEYFRTIYVGSGIWQEIGWGSIIYLSALTGIDPQLYEAAKIDGAGRLRQTWNITIPGIMSTIIVMLILRIGQIMSLGYEKVMLLYTPIIYEKADIISTYVYRVGLLEGMQFSYSTAIGLFNSVINLLLVVIANTISNKFTGDGLW